jgi:tetratricopeptide (TPR) repeat protein
MAYITGPAPPPAPKKKLSLPGGKLTKKEKPLWLTYRELADNEIRKALNELLHEDLPLEDPTLDDRDDEHHKSKTVKIDLVEKTNELFKFYDDARAKREGEAWAAAKALADKGDIAGATTSLDRMLAMNPDGGDKAAMADVYFKWGKQLEQKAQFADAAAAYSKAAGLDPKGPHATDALAAHHFTQGKALEAKGLDGGPDFRKAVALRPDYSVAKAAAAHAEGGAKPTWMLYAAGTALLAALGLFAAAMVRRRA